MSPPILSALSSERGEGLTYYLLVLAPFLAVIALVVLTIVMSSPS